jgi:hypothetical protein
LNDRSRVTHTRARQRFPIARRSWLDLPNLGRTNRRNRSQVPPRGLWPPGPSIGQWISAPCRRQSRLIVLFHQRASTAFLSRLLFSGHRSLGQLDRNDVSTRPDRLADQNHFWLMLESVRLGRIRSQNSGLYPLRHKMLRRRWLRFAQFKRGLNSTPFLADARVGTPWTNSIAKFWALPVTAQNVKATVASFRADGRWWLRFAQIKRGLNSTAIEQVHAAPLMEVIRMAVPCHFRAPAPHSRSSREPRTTLLPDHAIASALTILREWRKVARFGNFWRRPVAVFVLQWLNAKRHDRTHSDRRNENNSLSCCHTWRSMRA